MFVWHVLKKIFCLKLPFNYGLTLQLHIKSKVINLTNTKRFLNKYTCYAQWSKKEDQIPNLSIHPIQRSDKIENNNARIGLNKIIIHFITYLMY